MAEQPRTSGAAARIIAEEERLFGRVQSRVALGDEDEDVERVGAADVDKDLISLRDQIAEAKPEDLASLVEQMTRLAALRARLGGSRNLPIDAESPYFAHMTLAEDSKERDVLIGKRGFIDRQSNVQIVDWRNAPVSRIYYRYDEGDDYEEEMGGRRARGTVEIRRNISIAKGRLRRIGAPQGTFIRDARNVWHEAVGDAAPSLRGGQGKAARPLLREEHRGRGRMQRDSRPTGPGPGPGPGQNAAGRPGLGVHHGPAHRADKALPEIAALIDKEQFDLITQPDSGIVVIQGGAGSGKTTVALHRIAYLNFADGRRFRPGAMLMVVPSQALVRYVGGVLPALGVNGVPVVTYTGWARSTRLKLLPETPAKYNDDPPETVARLKKHPALLGVLEDWAAEQAAMIEAELVAAAGGAAELDPFIASWRAGSGPAGLVPRIAALIDRLKRSAVDVAVRTPLESVLRRWRVRADDVFTDWSELMTDPVRLVAGLSRHGAGDLGPRDVERTVRWVKQQIAAPPEPMVDDDGHAIETSDGRPVDDDDVPNGRMDDEDDPILLRLIQIKRGALTSASVDAIIYEHVAIDEAQDRSALEVKVLLEATQGHQVGSRLERSITIAGDTAQRLEFDNNFTGWDDLLAQTGQPAVVRPLRLSYRSTAEVMELARHILGPALAPEEPLVARSGAPVELHEFGDIGEAVAFLADALRGLSAREPTSSVALIARHPEQADAYHHGLSRAEVPALRRVRRDEFSFAPGIDVTDVAHVKGLEFDYVVMLDVNAASYPDAIEARHLLHIGVTRAAHQLWLITTGTPSPLLPIALHEGGHLAAVSDGGGTGGGEISEG